MERDSKREFENGTVPIQADETPSDIIRAYTHAHAYIACMYTRLAAGERAVVFQRAVDLVPHMHTYTGCLVNRRTNGN